MVILIILYKDFCDTLFSFHGGETLLSLAVATCLAIFTNRHFRKTQY